MLNLDRCFYYEKINKPIDSIKVVQPVVPGELTSWTINMPGLTFTEQGRFISAQQSPSGSFLDGLETRLGEIRMSHLLLEEGFEISAQFLFSDKVHQAIWVPKLWANFSFRGLYIQEDFIRRIGQLPPDQRPIRFTETGLAR